MQKYLPSYILCVIFVLTDLVTAWILGVTAIRYTTELVMIVESIFQYHRINVSENKLQIAKEEKEIEKREKESNDKDVSASASASSKPSSKVTPSALLVPSAYLFNPYVVFNCVGFTTTVFTNFLLAAALYSMINKSRIWSCLTIALLTLQGLYPVTLMVPATIYLVRSSDEEDRRIPYANIFKTVAIFSGILTSLYLVSYRLTGSWSFLQSTVGFILTVPDLRPNIGLYWYFFTEMFEHFRSLFVASFQINVGLLYVAPLALRFRRDPMLLAFSYLAIAAIFKSYPCLGEVGFYMALLPMWKHLFPRKCRRNLYFLQSLYISKRLNQVVSFFRYAARIHRRLFPPVLHSVCSDCMAPLDLFAIGECQFLLWRYAGLCYCSNFSSYRRSVC